MGNFDRYCVGSTYEYPGRVEYSVKPGWFHLAGIFLCAADCFYNLYSSLALYRQRGKSGGNAWWCTKYMLFTGVAGALITITVIQSIDMISPAKATIFIISTQLFISYLIEVMGLFGMEKVPFQWRKCIGAIIVIAGVVTFKWE